MAEAFTSGAGFLDKFFSVVVGRVQLLDFPYAVRYHATAVLSAVTFTRINTQSCVYRRMQRRRSGSSSTPL